MTEPSQCGSSHLANEASTNQFRVGIYRMGYHMFS